jgi:hypothetical protein
VPPGFWCTALLSMGILLSAITILNRSRLALAEAS